MTLLVTELPNRAVGERPKWTPHHPADLWVSSNSSQEATGKGEKLEFCCLANLKSSPELVVCYSEYWIIFCHLERYISKNVHIAVVLSRLPFLFPVIVRFSVCWWVGLSKWGLSVCHQLLNCFSLVMIRIFFLLTSGSAPFCWYLGVLSLSHAFAVPSWGHCSRALRWWVSEQVWRWRLRPFGAGEHAEVHL